MQFSENMKLKKNSGGQLLGQLVGVPIKTRSTYGSEHKNCLVVEFQANGFDLWSNGPYGPHIQIHPQVCAHLRFWGTCSNLHFSSNLVIDFKADLVMKLRDFKPRLKMQSEDVLGFFFWSWKSTVSARWVQLIFASKRSAYQHYPYFIGYLKASIKVLERVLTTTPCK